MSIEVLWDIGAWFLLVNSHIVSSLIHNRAEHKQLERPITLQGVGGGSVMSTYALHTTLTFDDNKPVGNNSLNDFMSNLLQKVHQSNNFTNYCIQATVLTDLGTDRFKACHIIFMSGHKNESAIKSSHSEVSRKQKRQISDSLSKQLGKDNAKIPEKRLKELKQTPVLAFALRISSPSLF